jgi:hypothetical protein
MSIDHFRKATITRRLKFTIFCRLNFFLIAEVWYLADPAILPKRPNGSIKNKNRVEKSLFTQNVNIDNIVKS